MEFYRGLNRLERGQLDVRDDVLRELGITLTIIGVHVTLGGFFLAKEAKRRLKLRRKGIGG